MSEQERSEAMDLDATEDEAEETSIVAGHIATEADNEVLPKPTLESFTFADEVDVTSPYLDATIDAVIALLKTDYTLVWEILYAKTEVVSLIREKDLFVKGERVSATWNLDKQMRATAIAHYLFTAQENSESCRQCKSPQSKGPMAECVAARGVVRGACLNCYYSGTAHEKKEKQEDKTHEALVRKARRELQTRYRSLADRL